MKNAPVKKDLNEVSTISIPEDTIDQIISLGKGQMIFVKNTTEGFLLDETLCPKLVGRIEKVSYEAVKFTDGKVDTIDNPDEDSLPQGFKLRARIRFATPDNKVLELKASEWTLKYRLSRYFDFLRRQGLNPGEVVTEVTITRQESKMGIFPALKFDIVARKMAGPHGGTSQGSLKITPEAEISLPPSSKQMPKQWL